MNPVASPPYSLLHRERVYQPGEDSYLLIDAVELADVPPFATIFELGCGSGVVSLGIKSARADVTLFSMDISRFAAENTLQGFLDSGLPGEVVQADMFTNVRSDIADVVLFNPPYVPTEPGDVIRDELDLAWAGGIDGREVTDRFLQQVERILAPGGFCILILEERNKIDELIEGLQSTFSFTPLKLRKCRGEKLHAYRVRPTAGS